MSNTGREQRTKEKEREKYALGAETQRILEPENMLNDDPEGSSADKSKRTPSAQEEEEEEEEELRAIGTDRATAMTLI